MALREARALHSRERRLVQQGVRDLAQLEQVLDLALEPSGSTEERDLARWLGWLVYAGLPIEEAHLAWRAHGAGAPPAFERAQRLIPLLEAHLPTLTDTEQIALIGNVDPQTAEQLIDCYGNAAADFLVACAGPSPITLRANAAHISAKALAPRLEEQGLQTTPGSWATHALHASERCDFNTIPAYKQGLFEVQDEGSQLLAELVQPDGGPVVDFCAGAGGKTLALAAAMQGKRNLLALDVRAGAIRELNKRVSRARVRGVTAATLSTTGALPREAKALLGRATRVLVDAPCSGSGVLRRHPEYRWRLGKVSHYPSLQQSILERAAPLVAPGGRLIYATCSVLRAEDEEVVEAFLRETTGFRLAAISEVLGQERASELWADQVLRLAPHSHNTDGFFAAVLIKES